MGNHFYAETEPLVHHLPSTIRSRLRDKKKSDEDEFLDPSIEHHAHLDITRIIAVCFVAIDHGEPSFGKYNALLAQQWVLQFLFLLCGVSFGLSKRPLHFYLGRLGLYFIVGVALNLAAYWVAGKDLTGSKFGVVFSVVFQFWFVVTLMILAILLAPMRMYMRRRACAIASMSEQFQLEAGPGGITNVYPSQNILKVALSLSSIIVLTSLIFMRLIVPILEVHLSPALLTMCDSMSDTAKAYWDLPRNLEETQEFIVRFCGYCQVSVNNLIVIFIYTYFVNKPRLIGWFVILHTYVCRMTIYRAGEERLHHAFDLMLIGLTCFCFGLAYRQRVGKYMARYWFIFVTILYLLWTAELSPARLDVTPPLDLKTRMKINLIELGLIIFWLTAAERALSPRIFTEDRLKFLNLWALAVFLLHKAIHTVMPSPWNWISLLALLPLCWWRTNKK